MASAFAYGLALLNQNTGIVLALLFFLLLSLSPILLRIYQGKRENWTIFLLASLLILLALPLRLAYIRHVFLPPYFDSAEHARIISSIISGLTSPAGFSTFSKLTPTYYHIGFHLIASFLTLITRNQPTTIMLFLGQVVLALLPIPVLFLVWMETDSKTAALLSAILAGFAWSMPGFAINWGKYPMLTGMLFGEAALLYLYIFAAAKEKTRNAHFLVPSLAILAAVAVHTRILILVSLVILSWFFAKKLSAFKPLYQALIMTIIILSTTSLALSIYKDPLLKLTLEPYLLKKGIYATAIIAALSPFALEQSQRGVYFSLFFIIGIFLCLFIPAGDFFGLADQKLLDRPFVETILFLPLSILGGLGFSGFLAKTKTLFHSEPIFLDGLIFLLVGAFSVFALINYEYAPSPCCTFVGSDDIILMEWIRNNLAEDEKILVAANLLEIMPDVAPSDLVGSDAGIWIPYLTGRNIHPLVYTVDFTAPETRDFLCRREITYIYLGNTPLSFNRTIQEKNWYSEAISLPHAALYSLTNCSTQ